MGICGSLMDIYDRTMLHALAQPRKGLFMEIQKIKIYGNLWLIDGHL